MSSGAAWGTRDPVPWGETIYFDLSPAKVLTGVPALALHTLHQEAWALAAVRNKASGFSTVNLFYVSWAQLKFTSHRNLPPILQGNL